MAKGKLKPFYGKRTGNKRIVRSIKMLYPECKTEPNHEGVRQPRCESDGFGWWEKCPHDPYHHAQVEETRTPVLEKDEDGDDVVVDWKIKRKYVHRPNFTQVDATIQINSGQSIEKARRRGFKSPEEVQPTLADGSPDPEFSGYAPRCQFYNCDAAVNIQSKFGDYCDRDHAALIQLVETETPLYVEGDRLRKQMDDVVLTQSR